MHGGVTEIRITALEPGAYGVELVEGDVITNHRVRVPPAMVDDLFPAGVDEQRLVRESFEFLLEHEKASSILSEFALDRIADYFPDYFDDLRARLAG